MKGLKHRNWVYVHEEKKALCSDARPRPIRFVASSLNGQSSCRRFPAAAAA